MNYVVKERHSVCTLSGIKGPGDVVTEKDFHRGEKDIKALLARDKKTCPIAVEVEKEPVKEEDKEPVKEEDKEPEKKTNGAVRK